jgi:hypothetical protein
LLFHEQGTTKDLQHVHCKSGAAKYNDRDDSRVYVTACETAQMRNEVLKKCTGNFSEQ